MNRWYLVAAQVVGVALIVAVLVLVTAAVVGARGHHKRPVCTSAISSIRVEGDHTVRGPVVWFPKGCKHG